MIELSMKYYNIVLVESAGTLHATFKHSESTRNWDACLQKKSLTVQKAKIFFKAAHENVPILCGIFQLLCIVDTFTHS